MAPNEWRIRSEIASIRRHLKLNTPTAVVCALGGFFYSPANGGYYDSGKIVLNDVDANRKATVTSRRGSIEAAAVVTQTVRPGQIFIPMHYRETNRLTASSFDPHSPHPNYKAYAVSVAPV